MLPPPRILSIAGSDSSGGAGVQADIKTITALGGYAASVVTAVTVQDTLGVHEIHRVPADVVAAQLRVVLCDIGADAIKTGMLCSLQVIQRVVQFYDSYARGAPLVVDPVLCATSGEPLLDADARRALCEQLFRRAALVTPNVPEAELLSGCPITRVADFGPALDAILAQGASAVLIKGGHLPGERVVDVLRTADGDEERYEYPRIETTSTHGTGCTLASAIAVGVGEGLRLSDAVARARDFLQGALAAAPGFGQGFGPLDHAFLIRRGLGEQVRETAPAKSDTWH